MKSHGKVWANVVAAENLHAAALRAARGKRHRAPVARFLDDAEREVERLRTELIDGTYVPRAYMQFRVRDPKPRTISCADFRDRVVHQALCAAIGPVIERRMVPHSFACRVGKGAHRAVLDAERFCRRYLYFLKLDIRKFFESVDHAALLGVLGRLFRERNLLLLLETIVRHPVPGNAPGKGIPIGNLTSQWFANLYLDAMDHLVVEQWRVCGYVRYMDDMVLWADEKPFLWQAKARIGEWLAAERQLCFKEASVRVCPCTEGLPFLGLRVYPNRLRLQRGRFLRLRRLVRRRERECLRGEISPVELVDVVRAATGVPAFWGLRGLVAARLDV